MGGDTNIVAGTSGGQQVQLTVSDSIFYSENTTAFMNVPTTGLQFTNNNLFVVSTSGNGFVLNDTFLSTINNNVITGPGGSATGIIISGSTNTVVGNTFNGFATGTFLGGLNQEHYWHERVLQHGHAGGQCRERQQCRYFRQWKYDRRGALTAKGYAAFHET
jgi:hypothetical protein